MRVEFISNESAIARVRYHFWQTRKNITIEYLATGKRFEAPAPKTDFQFRTRNYPDAIKVCGLPIDLTTDEDEEEMDENTEDEETELVEGVYDITIIPWEVFLEKYHPNIFFQLFKGKSNWAAFFRNGRYIPSQTPIPLLSPQPQT